MISRVSKSQSRTPNQLEDIASESFWVFSKKTQKLMNGLSSPFNNHDRKTKSVSQQTWEVISRNPQDAPSNTPSGLPLAFALV